MFKYYRVGKFFLSVAKDESLDGKGTGKCCQVFDYTGGGGYFSPLMLTRKKYLILSK